MVVLGPASAATLMCLVGWAPAYAVLALLLITAGISSAAFHAVASAAAGRASHGHLGKGLSIWMVGGEVGSTLGPLVAAAALFVVLVVVLLQVNWPVAQANVPDGTLVELGKALVNPDQYLLVFEVASVLLLVALVGSVVIARER